MAEPVQSEITSCLLCGCETNTSLYITRDRLYGVPGEFRLVRCARCNLVYLSPRPTLADIGQYYPAGYDPFIPQRLDDMPLPLRWSVRYGLRKRCRLVCRFRRRGRLLDVGCATGQFLAEMVAFPGWEVMGVEPSVSAAEFAQAYGFPVHQGDLSSAHYPQGSFDVVTLWDVFEHLHDPLAVLVEARRILKPDGVLILRTPSLDSWDAKVFGQCWGHLDSPRHLVLFSQHTAIALLRKGGFTVRYYRTGGGSYFGLLLSTRCWLRDNIASPMMRQMAVFLVKNPLMRVFLALPLAISDAVGLGSEMVIAAQSDNPHKVLEEISS